MSAAGTISFARHAAARRLAKLFDQHARLGSLCDRLETIADDLPRSCPSRCNEAAAELAVLLTEHHAFEREVLATLLQPRQPDLFDRIFRQHSEDEGLAGEIVEALTALGSGAAVADPETVGYMLRCFFTNYRRSMLVEELAIRSALDADTGA
jgi:hypothetical protein